MRKLIEYCLISADGIVLNDPFPFKDYLDDNYLRERVGLFEACDAMLFGRTTYERFARTSAARQGGPRYLARLDAMKKYVFSSKLERAAWNNSTIVRGDIAAEVARLKQQEGRDLLLLGHGLLGQKLLSARLIDVIDLGVHPILLGHGTSFFREGQAAALKLASTKSFSKIVKLTYEPQYP